MRKLHLIFLNTNNFLLWKIFPFVAVEGKRLCKKVILELKYE